MAAAIKELVVVSGRGGAGKTCIVSALAAIINEKVLADCNVNSANLHQIIEGHVLESGLYMTGWKVKADLFKCRQCEICDDLCRYGAIQNGIITELHLCVGCGVCADHCPEKVLQMQPRYAGEWTIWKTLRGPMVGAQLEMATEYSGQLVSKVKDLARRIAGEKEQSLILVDSPSGADYSAIAAIMGATLVLLVVAPTVSALHDAKQFQEVTAHFRLPLCVCINQCNLHDGVRSQIRDWCKANEIPVVCEIPYSEEFRLALRECRSVMEGHDMTVKNKMVRLWLNLSELLKMVN